MRGYWTGQAAKFAFFAPVALKFISIAGKIAPIALIWAACTELSKSPENLTATTKAAVSGPDCASCHAYPLRDTNHVYHMFYSDSSITNDRPITCLHCHDRSIAAHTVPFIDSVFRDTNGNEYHGLDFPGDTELRTFTLVRVETLTVRRAIPAPPREGTLPVLQEWVTSLAHLNGTVDVEFNSTSHDTSRWQGQRAIFNPEKETCSAVACHPNHGPYRWADPARGLTLLKGDSIERPGLSNPAAPRPPAAP